jgi:hypothetical protein
MAETTRLERTSHVVPGDRSELRLEDGHLTLTKEAGTQARPTSVTVPVDQVRSVTLQRPSRGRPGWLHLAVVNGSPTPPSELAATGDPYTLPLTTRHLHAARRLERMIDDHVRRRGLPHVESGAEAGTGSGVIVNPPLPPPPSEPPSSTMSPGDPGAGTDAVAPPDSTAAGAPATGAAEEATGAAEGVPGAAEGASGSGAESPAPGAPVPPPPPPSGSAVPEGEIPRDQLAGHLRELADLHEAGALTDTEFEQAKRRVLGD